jgi:hypothetical protein
MGDNKIKVALYTLLSIVFIAICVGCYILGRNSVEIPKVNTEIKWDTLHVEKPIPHYIDKVRTEYVYVHTPADTIVREEIKEVIRVDSVLIAVDVERRTYGDERYRAIVSGAVVGDIHPSLDEIDIYQKTEIRTIEPKPKIISPYVSICAGDELWGVGGGISFRQKMDVGAKYLRINRQNAWMVEASYRF